ncbi:hypothetical protein AD933_14105 [Acetobacter malorum]|uniref:Uncharacterized protein n=1 Tax=Acetobacter malorum TaxID=178901 RepID=A0A149RJF0_9PROT|nr:hypothetical protein [Acetobacter malorum]KXV14056.1 hypothetical protein AD933_14105 [Acetobacter malorum]
MSDTQPQQKPMQDLDLADEVGSGSTVVALVNWGTDEAPAWQAMRIPVALLAQSAVAGQRDTSSGIAALSASHKLMIGGVEILGKQDSHVLMVADLLDTDPCIKRCMV